MARRIPKYQQPIEPPVEPAPSPTRIPADISQQAPHNSYSAVPMFYEDTPFRCVDCGREEVWTAEQQKWWYETAKGSIHSRAVRCHACRAARRGSTAAPEERS